MIRDDLLSLMSIPGLSGHEDRVRRAIAARLDGMGLANRTDRMGNLIATLPGTGPSVMVFAHMDQLGFVVRKIDEDGGIRVERLGGVPERTVLAQAVVLAGRHGDVTGIIGAPSHHVTPPEEKLRAIPAADLRIDTGHGSAGAAREAGIEIGTPVTYAPRTLELAGGRVAGTAVDDRAGCAVLLALAERWKGGPTLHIVWTVQEEFDLRGAVPAARALAPDAAVQIDLMVATDQPEAAHLGEMRLGGGPGMSLYAFHGRGTLAGLIPHPGMVRLMEEAAGAEAITLQRQARVGVLTDTSWVQHLGEGVACIDMGFPMRHSHSPLEMVDPADLEALTALLLAALPRLTEAHLERP